MSAYPSSRAGLSKAAALVLYVVVGLCLVSSPGWGLSWMPDQLLVDSDYGLHFPSVASDSAGNVLVVWPDVSNEMFWRLSYKFWNGITWSESQVLSEMPMGASSQAITADRNGQFYAVWSSSRDISVPGLYYKYWDGTAWSQDYHLAGDSTDTIMGPSAIATDQLNRVHVAWWQNDESGVSLKYVFWDGSSWSTEQTIATGNGGFRSNGLTCDSSGNVHVVWIQIDGTQEIYYRRFDGSSWLSIERLSSDDAYGDDYPTIASSPDGKVSVVWDKDLIWGEHRIVHRQWDGVSWSPEEMIVSVQTYTQPQPYLVADGRGALHLVWLEGNESILGIFYMYRTSAGWSYVRRLTDDLAAPMSSQLAADYLGTVHLVWYDSNVNPNGAIYYKMRKHCLDGDEFADCRNWYEEPYGQYPLFETRYSAEADTLPQPPGVPVFFDSTRVTTGRDPDFRFFISGRPDELAPWVCDDKLYIDGVDAGLGFAGVADSSLPLCRPIEDVLIPVAPRDVTDFLPEGQNCVTFKLADTQRAILGNTRIYLVRVDASGVAEDSVRPAGLDLQVFPNPARAEAIFQLAAVTDGRYRLVIYSVAGRLVYAFPEVAVAAGERNSWVWRGQDEQGRIVGRGTYFCSVSSPGGQTVKKVLFLR